MCKTSTINPLIVLDEVLFAVVIAISLQPLTIVFVRDPKSIQYIILSLDYLGVKVGDVSMTSILVILEHVNDVLHNI